MLHAESDNHWPINLRHNTRLRSLQIELGHDSAYDETRLVKQMLSQISSAHMEEVGLEIVVGDIGQLRWNEVDAALQHSSFSGLGTVIVRVVPWPFIYDCDPNIVSWIKDHMPGCHACGILHVQWVERQSSYFLP
jgi:hypothetical protein